MISSMRTFRHYLLSGSFVVYSDHEALRSAIKKNYIHGRLTRRLKLIAEYEFEIRHLPGKKMLRG